MKKSDDEKDQDKNINELEEKIEIKDKDTEFEKNDEIKNDTEVEKPKINKKKQLIDILFIILVFIGIFTYMIKAEGADNLIQMLTEVDKGWIVIGMICLILMWLCDALNLQIMLKKLYPKQKFTNSIKVTMIGNLFSNITPSSSGGQPMQAYYLAKTGKKPSDSFSILMMKFVITQTTLIILTILIGISQFNFFATVLKQYTWIGVLGIILNVGLLVVIILAGIKEGFLIKIANPIIKFLGKIKLGKHKLIKNVDKATEKFNSGVANYSEQFIKMKQQKGLIAKVAIIGLIQSALYYTITYTVYRAMGNSGANLFQIIVLQAFLQLIMTFTPTPGAGLGAEGGFYLLFSSIFQKGSIGMSILFWRMYTFYLPIIIGAFFLIPNKEERTERKREKKVEKEKRKLYNK